MNLNHIRRKAVSRIMTTWTASAFTAAITAPCFANPMPEERIPQPPCNQSQLAGCAKTTDHPRTGGQIIVTGTRIISPALRDIEPTVTLGAPYLADRNLTNLADALNEIPGFRQSITPDGVQNSFGQGVNFLNAFNLGSNRTLTLVNGRRVVSSNVPTIFANATPGTQVDLNTIPAILVERVDRIGIGGAPVYGSDAIAGTVNIILKRDLDRLDLRATSGITDHGDNFRANLSGAYGAGFAGGRGHMTLALTYDEANGVRQSQRSFYRDNVSDLPNLMLPGLDQTTDGRLNSGIGYDFGPNDGNPGTVLVRNSSVPFLTSGGLIFGGALDRAVQFGPDGNLVPFDRGAIFAGPFASGGDGYQLGDIGQVTSDLNRFSANMLLDYELGNTIRLFGEAAYFHSRADELADQPDFNAVLFGGVSSPLVMPVSNPFLTDQARNLLLSNNYGAFVLSRANGDLGDPTGYATNDVYRGVLGISGEFSIGKTPFDFEASFSWGRSDFTDHDQQINQQNFINAVNVTRAPGGSIICDAAPLFPVAGLPVADPQCRPLNLFGQGAASAEALSYIQQNVRADSRLEQWVASANIGGSPVSLFGNPARFNIGVEHREERARFAPDAFQQAGLGRSIAVMPSGGRYNLDEAFGELYLPLLTPKNDALITRIDLFARARYTHNSVNGGSFAWSAGGRFQPVPDIQFRGNFTRSFRSPAITELFYPQSPARVTVPDLCSAANRNGGSRPDIRARNCAAFLAAFPGATPLQASAITVPALTGGNPDLTNEKADSWTIGAIVTPQFLPGLSLSADYLGITIRNPIAFLSVTELASACFDNPAFNLADPANGNSFCAAIGRDANGQVGADPANPVVRSGFVNGNRIEFSGIQASLAYQTALGRIGLPGNLSAAGELFYVRRQVQDLTGVNPIRLDGLIGNPEFEAQLRLRYNGEGWGMAAHVNYIGKQLFSRFNRGNTPSDAREIDALNAFATVDASLFIAPISDLRINLAVTNLFDRQGQSYFGYLVPASINDALGRRFSLSVAKAF